MKEPIIQTSSKTQTKVQTADQLLFDTILEALEDKKAEKIISIDLKEIEEAAADYFIICEVNSGIQMAAVANHVEKQVRELMAEKPYQFELSPSWTLVDYINIVVHIFLSEERKFYDLEGLWLDGILQEH
ncbi:MAG: ribosome silencing factor [Bacteroidia bacterium]|nr:MAG: ribosome silencing factor [Bacteroidia bacterium]